MNRKMIEGIQVLLSTPMREDGGLDYDSALALVEHVIQGGVDGIILLAHVCAFSEPSVYNSLKIRGRFPVFEKV